MNVRVRLSGREVSERRSRERSRQALRWARWGVIASALVGIAAAVVGNWMTWNIAQPHPTVAASFAMQLKSLPSLETEDGEVTHEFAPFRRFALLLNNPSKDNLTIMGFGVDLNDGGFEPVHYTAATSLNATAEELEKAIDLPAEIAPGEVLYVSLYARGDLAKCLGDYTCPKLSVELHDGSTVSFDAFADNIRCLGEDSGTNCSSLLEFILDSITVESFADLPCRDERENLHEHDPELASQMVCPSEH